MSHFSFKIFLSSLGLLFLIFFPNTFFESYFPLFLSFRFFPERIFTFPRKELWPFPRKWRLLVLQKGKKSTCLWSYCAFVSFFIQKVIGGVTAFKKTGNFFPRLCLFKPLSPPGSKSKASFNYLWVSCNVTKPFLIGYRHLSLQVPNFEFNFNVKFSTSMYP